MPSPEITLTVFNIALGIIGVVFAVGAGGALWALVPIYAVGVALTVREYILHRKETGGPE